MPRTLFADTFYWIALIDPRDSLHAAAHAYGSSRGPIRLVTTDEIFDEVLAFFAGTGPYWRSKAAAVVRDAWQDPNVDVLAQTRADFAAALAHYEARPDKDYSLTDCRSMNALRALGISEVLTNDHHFTQEGFTITFP
jgi:uncharacterized protein